MVNIKENLKLIDSKYYFLVLNLVVLFLCKENIISNKFLLLIIAINFILLNKKIINDIEFLLWGVILPSEIYLLINIGIFLIKNLFGNKKRFKSCIEVVLKEKKLLYFLSFIIVLNLIKGIIRWNFLSPIMSITYLSIMIGVYIALKGKKVKFENFMNHLDILIFGQFIVLIAQSIYYGRFYPSDVFSGTFINAHMLGVWLGWYIIIQLIKVFKSKSIENILKCVLAIIFMYLTDSKHIIIGLILGAIIFGILNLIKNIKNKTLIAGILILVGMYICTNLVASNVFKEQIDNDAYIYNYMYEEPYNNKFNYFDVTLNQNMKGVEFLFGFGSGVYGSRIANLRAHEYMAKDSGTAIALSKFVPGYVLTEYKEFAEKYDEKYLESVSDMSAVLSYPFSSIISVFAEMGVIGYILLLLFISKKEEENKYIYGIISISMLCLMIFDSYFEMTQVAILFWILLGVTYEKNIVSN